MYPLSNDLDNQMTTVKSKKSKWQIAQFRLGKVKFSQVMSDNVRAQLIS